MDFLSAVSILSPDSTKDSTEFNIRPNGAYKQESWRWLMLALIVISCGIGLRLAWLGFWMVLPFAIIDMLVVMLVIRMVRRRSAYVEKIRICDERVEIQHLQKGKNQDWQFPLYWSRVELKKPQHHWYPHRLLIGSSGQWIEVGSCLTDEERLSLAGEIKREIKRALDQSRYTHA